MSGSSNSRHPTPSAAASTSSTASTGTSSGSLLHNATPSDSIVRGGEDKYDKNSQPEVTLPSGAAAAPAATSASTTTSATTSASDAKYSGGAAPDFDNKTASTASVSETLAPRTSASGNTKYDMLYDDDEGEELASGGPSATPSTKHPVPSAAAVSMPHHMNHLRNLARVEMQRKESLPYQPDFEMLDRLAFAALELTRKAKLNAKDHEDYRLAQQYIESIHRAIIKAYDQILEDNGPYHTDLIFRDLWNDLKSIERRIYSEHESYSWKKSISGNSLRIDLRNTLNTNNFLLHHIKVFFFARERTNSLSKSKHNLGFMNSALNFLNKKLNEAKTNQNSGQEPEIIKLYNLTTDFLNLVNHLESENDYIEQSQSSVSKAENFLKKIISENPWFNEQHLGLFCFAVYQHSSRALAQHLQNVGAQELHKRNLGAVAPRASVASGAAAAAAGVSPAYPSSSHAGEEKKSSVAPAAPVQQNSSQSKKQHSSMLSPEKMIHFLKLKSDELKKTGELNNIDLEHDVKSKQTDVYLAKLLVNNLSSQLARNTTLIAQNQKFPSSSPHPNADSLEQTAAKNAQNLKRDQHRLRESQEDLDQKNKSLQDSKRVFEEFKKRKKDTVTNTLTERSEAFKRYNILVSKYDQKQKNNKPKIAAAATSFYMLDDLAERLLKAKQQALEGAKDDKEAKGKELSEVTAMINDAYLAASYHYTNIDDLFMALWVRSGGVKHQDGTPETREVKALQEHYSQLRLNEFDDALDNAVMEYKQIVDKRIRGFTDKERYLSLAAFDAVRNTAGDSDVKFMALYKTIKDEVERTRNADGNRSNFVRLMDQRILKNPNLENRYKQLEGKYKSNPVFKEQVDSLVAVGVKGKKPKPHMGNTLMTSSTTFKVAKKGDAAKADPTKDVKYQTGSSPTRRHN